MRTSLGVCDGEVTTDKVPGEAVAFSSVQPRTGGIEERRNGVSSSSMSVVLQSEELEQRVRGTTYPSSGRIT